jgi:hypothetical protein
MREARVAAMVCQSRTERPVPRPCSTKSIEHHARTWKDITAAHRCGPGDRRVPGSALGGSGADADPYALTAVALLRNDGTDIYLTVSSSTPDVPDRIDKIQVKALPFDGDQLQTRNYFDLAASGGVAVLHVGDLARHRRLELVAHVKDGNQNNVEAATQVLLRPDLTVAQLSVPADVVRRQQLNVTARVDEIAGDSGAMATATLLAGAVQLGSKPVTVDAGGSATVSFATLLAQAGRYDLRVVISDTAPAEANVSNDEAVQAVDVHMYTNNGVVSTDHWVATKVGEDILHAGGNAIDAAAAIEFALNVVDPNLTGLGGSSAVVVRLADGNEWAIDGREVAPHATTTERSRGRSSTHRSGCRRRSRSRAARAG